LYAIFAGGTVELKGGCLDSLLIVSCGDVTLKCDVRRSLIIARGTVTCTDPVIDSRIISGKSVVYNKTNARNCIITENESNPLGFIRWSDALKDKAAPKSK
jgi:hypothetical protein